MSWYTQNIARVKIASVTFGLENAHRIAQPKDLVTLSWELRNFAYRENPALLEHMQETVTPDGSYDGFIGTINFYFNPQTTQAATVKQTIDRWIQEISLLDIKASCSGIPQHSGMYQGKQVLRIKILANGTESLEQVPEANFSNMNAIKIIQLLGGSTEDYGGSMQLAQAHTILDHYLRLPVDEFDLAVTGYTRQNIDTHNVQIPPDATPEERQQLVQQQMDSRKRQVREIDPGLSANDIKDRLYMIQKIVDYGMRNGFKLLTWG